MIAKLSTRTAEVYDQLKRAAEGCSQAKENVGLWREVYLPNLPFDYHDRSTAARINVLAAKGLYRPVNAYFGEVLL